MNTRAKRIFTVSIIAFIVILIASVVYFLFAPKTPSTQNSDKTVIIDNYSEYTSHISADSFGYLGNYLYGFINEPSQGVYHATIVDGSYTYDSDSWFSTFTVKLVDNDISWNVSIQTLKNGEINGDIKVTCASGGAACLSMSSKINSTTHLQDLLPLTTDDYIISYQKDNYDGLSIVYYDHEDIGKTKALEKIKSLGFKPEDYTIQYYYGGH